MTNWFRQGLSENDVMTLAGHSSFATTHDFYLAVADDLVDRARQASAQVLSQDLLQKCCSRISETETKKADSHKRLPAKNLTNGQEWI